MVGKDSVFVYFLVNSFRNVEYTADTKRVEHDSAAADCRVQFPTPSFSLARVPQPILESIRLTFGADSKGKSTSIPLGAGQRSEGGNIIFRVSLGLHGLIGAVSILES